MFPDIVYVSCKESHLEKYQSKKLQRNQKFLVFAFILATVPSFHGYYMKGGALEVGKASTKSFIWTSVSIVVFNFLITQMLLG